MAHACVVAGALSYEELWNKLSDSGLADAEIERLFFQLDANSDGKVSHHRMSE